jgi:hypothetical protein
MEGTTSIWRFDSMCNAHLMPYKQRLFNYRPFDKPEFLGNIFNDLGQVEGIGSTELTDQQGRKHVLHGVLYAPKANKQLLCTAKLIREDDFQIDYSQVKSTNEFTIKLAKTGFTLP